MTSKQNSANSAPDNAPVPGIYKHYKGNLYQVFGLARHSETEGWLVVYQALYAERGYWVRPLSIWLEPVKPSAESSKAGTDAMPQRFQLINENKTSLDKLAQLS